MENKKLDTLVESFFNPKEVKNNLDLGYLVDLIEEQLANQHIAERVDEQATDRGTKFVLSLPRLAPSEAWGDPETMDRKQVDKIFSVVRGGSNIAARIQFLNDYLNPKKAARKTSPRVIINSMMIIESLKGALNHFNESSAGFVFEGFMAALTGGFQQAGRVGGTLPIEDFVAFSQFGGQNVPVSLKLLSQSTLIKGSFTNLVDYLFVRGEPAIKYMVAYKTKEEGGAVGKLTIYDFDITRENLIDFLIGSSKMSRSAMGGTSANKIKAAIASGDEMEIAKAFVQMPGYTKAGMLNKVLQGEKLAVSESSETFHEAEKSAMLEEDTVLSEGYGGDTQWAVSFKQMNDMGANINLTHHGDLDFSSERINQVANIYSKRLGDQVLELLESMKSLTDNIGGYFSERYRQNAMTKGSQAATDASKIESNLKQQMSGDTEETS